MPNRYEQDVLKVWPNSFYSNCMRGVMNYNGKGSIMLGRGWKEASDFITPGHNPSSQEINRQVRELNAPEYVGE